MKADLEIHVKFAGEWLVAGIRRDADSSFIPHIMDIMVIEMAKDFQKVLETGEIPKRVKETDSTNEGGLDFN